jgi:hypothetical protein
MKTLLHFKVPYVLAVQAIFFYIPRFIWRSMSQFSGYDLPASVQYIDHLWSQIRASHFQTRIEHFERMAGPYLWDGIRLARRRNRGQLALYYVLYTLIQALNATAMFVWLNSLVTFIITAIDINI